MSRSYKYRFLVSALARTRFHDPALSLALRSACPVIACYGGSRLATEVLHEGEESQFIGFTTILRGDMAMAEAHASTRGTPSQGLVLRLRHQTPMLTTDDSARAHVSFRLSELGGRWNTCWMPGCAGRWNSPRRWIGAAGSRPA